MTKALTIFCLLFALSQACYAQKENDPIFYLIKEKNRIDKLDGKLDGRLKLADSTRTALANKIYFTTVDSIWRSNVEGRRKRRATRFDCLLLVLYIDTCAKPKCKCA
jgi:hypothetical protein